MGNESKCHAFWKTGRNPITMKKCREENFLHVRNRSAEQNIARDQRRQNGIDKKEGFTFDNQ
jgi:hypothetical protein|tara:strand:- start:2479 stop:2664 length:186 start_codon:yes stop_codon:yes gene_type:complete